MTEAEKTSGRPALPPDYDALARNNCRRLGDLLERLNASLDGYRSSYGQLLKIYQDLTDCFSPAFRPKEDLAWQHGLIAKLGDLKPPAGETEKALKTLEANNIGLQKIQDILEAMLYSDIMR